ncbi:TBC1D2_1 [Blepharisma stoltei]|uniref:Rab-GAP TBC domain-containing protein n=1 Tax=Blepharisma stoltei TaxID=1481888 RepID=A0AAU9IU42_9CILI|nr:unnamed protein product [Blepharisma stoltei]
MANQQTIKTWPEFLRLQGSYETKINTLRASNLSYINPQTQRPLAWVALVDPRFASECLHFFHTIKNQKQVTISANIAKQIRKEAPESYIGALSALKGEEKIQKIVTILSMFVSKRADIGYHSGMNFIVAVLLEVFKLESDTFVMLCHIIEKIYPGDYFSCESRKLGLHRELRVLVMMASKLRPRLAATLKAVFNPKNSNTKEDDLTPFVSTIKRIGFSWFSTLFVPNVLPFDLLRIWDNMLIHGFEFVLKLALTLLSKYEKFLRNTIKAETKAISLENSVDSLLVAGNLTRMKLMQKFEKLPIEKMIKKAIVKSTYKILKRDELLGQAENLEKNHLERLYRLRQSKMILRNRGLIFSFNEALDIYQSFDQLNKEFVTREEFVKIAKMRLQWYPSHALNIFNTFDQEGNDSIEITQIKSGLAILTQCSIDEKLTLCFQAHDKERSEHLSPDDIFNLISCIEKSLDYRSEYFKTQSTGFFESLDINDDGKIPLAEFIRSAKIDPSCTPIIDFINAVESNEYIQVPEMKMAQIHLEGTFSDIHSPITPISDASPMSDISGIDDLPNEENNYYEPEAPIEIPQIEINENIGEIVEEVKNDTPKMEEKQEDKPIFDFGFEKFDNGGIDEDQYDTVVRTESLTVDNKIPIESIEYPVLHESYDSKRKIELPEPVMVPKEPRPGCSRLCTRETCLIF